MSTLHLGVAVRTAQAGAIEAAVGAAPSLELWTGALPANCAAADSGTKIAEGALPADWLAAAAAGAVGMEGDWTVTGLAAAGTGTNAVHFRLRQSGTVHMQGDVTHTSGSGALRLENINIANGQSIAITGATITQGNA